MGNSIDLKQKFFSIKTLVSFLLAFAIIYLLITRMDVTEVSTVIRHTDPLLYLAGFAVYYLAFPLRGMRFHTMLKNNECEVPTGELTRIIYVSWFANCVVPAKLGDIFRAYLVRRKCGHPFINTVGTIFAERVFDLFILYLLIGISGLIASRGIIPPAMMIVLETSFVILAVILAVLVLMKFYSTKLVSRLPEKARAVYEKFLAGTMSSFSHNWQIAGLTTAIWFLEGASFYMVTRALGIDLPFVNVIFIGLFSALLTALPITPAGLGFVETAKVGMLLFFQVNRNFALSAALLDRVINYWSLLIIGFIVYMATEAKLNKEVGPDESDDCHSYIQ